MMFDDVGSISPHRATSVARTLREVEWKASRSVRRASPGWLLNERSA